MPNLDLEATPAWLKFTILADVPLTDAYEVVTLVLLEAHSRRLTAVRRKIANVYRQPIVVRAHVKDLCVMLARCAAHCGTSSAPARGGASMSSSRSMNRSVDKVGRRRGESAGRADRWRSAALARAHITSV